MQRSQEIAHIESKKRGAEVARRLNAEAVAGPHGHKGIASKVEEQVKAVHIGIFHLGAQLLPPRTVAQRSRGEVMVEHRAQHFLIHCSHQKQHNAASQQVRILRSGIPSVRILSEPPGCDRWGRM